MKIIEDDESDWMSTTRAGEHLGLTVRTLYRLINSGEVRAYRFGRVIRLQRRDLDAFIASSEIRPGDLDHLDRP
jgi:excisionase family DNA binding protein